METSDTKDPNEHSPGVDPLLSVQQLVVLLVQQGFPGPKSPSTIRRALETGRLQAVQSNGKIYVRTSAALEWLADRYAVRPFEPKRSVG